MKILFCNVGWMRDYNGATKEDFPVGKAKYLNIKNKIGHEECNFRKVGEKVYGFVWIPGQMDIKKNFGAGKDADSISGVTVIWVAPRPEKEGDGMVVVGWYRNATVYRDYRTIKNSAKTRGNPKLDYRIEALWADATLLPLEKRSLLVPGFRNIWYAKSSKGKAFIREVQNFMEKGVHDVIPDIDLNLSGKEGKSKLVTHLVRERDQTLVNNKKKQILTNKGKLACEVCGFDFHSVYGKLGTEFCEVHHKKSLAKAKGEVRTKLNDLAIVCSNCHRMLHRQDLMSINQLKNMVQRSKQNRTK
ncbi:MAG: HNH endonuclease [Gammaproteobacteria bacterium]